MAVAFTLIPLVTMHATVLTKITVKCPICGEENAFWSFAGWGDYLYYYPSRFQMVFFPQTYPTALWTCKKCHYTAWGTDFKDLPPEKIAAVRKAVDAAPAIPAFKEYAEVPMSARLATAERVYRELGRDDLFWAHFNQVKGYHLGVCGQTEEAKEARLKARDLLQKLVADPKYAEQRKGMLIALAAMRHYTGDDKAAMETLAMAATEPNPNRAGDKNDTSFFDKLIAEYKDGIKTNRVPDDKQSVNLLPGISVDHDVKGAGEEQLWTVRACENNGVPRKTEKPK